LTCTIVLRLVFSRVSTSETERENEKGLIMG
jgi:hypothetical protein